MTTILFSWYERPDNRYLIGAVMSGAACAGAHFTPTENAIAFDDCYEYVADTATLAYVRRALRSINRYGRCIDWHRIA